MCSMVVFNWVKIYIGYGFEILELLFDILVDLGGGEVFLDFDYS